MYFIMSDDGELITSLKENKFVDVPQGFTVVESVDYKGCVKLPKSVKKINSRCFEGLKIKELITSRNLELLKKNSLIGVKRLVLLGREEFEDLELEDGWDNGIKDVIFGDSLNSFWMTIRRELFN